MQIVFFFFLIFFLIEQKGEVVSRSHGVIAHCQLEIAGEDAGSERFVLALNKHRPCRLFPICIASIPRACHGGITKQVIVKLPNSPCHGASCVLSSSPSRSRCSFPGFHVWEYSGSHVWATWDWHQLLFCFLLSYKNHLVQKRDDLSRMILSSRMW